MHQRQIKRLQKTKRTKQTQKTKKKKLYEKPKNMQQKLLHRLTVI